MDSVIRNFRLFAAALAALTLAAAPVRADQILGFGRIDSWNRVLLPGGPTLGTFNGGRFTATPDTLKAQSPGSVIPWKRSEEGAAVRNLFDKLSERISVMDFGAKGDGFTDDSAAITNAFKACYAAGGGDVYFPATGKDYRIVTGQSFSGNTCGAVGAGLPNWPGPSGTKAQWTQFGSWISCEDATKPCLQFNGSGYVRGLNFWNNQPEPSETPGVAWTPLDLPHTIVFKQNFSWAENLQFANVSRGIAWDFPTNANIAGTYSGYRNIYMGSFREGGAFVQINDTMHGSNWKERHLWHISNPNVIDWMEGAGSDPKGARMWRIKYLDNAQFEAIECYKKRVCLYFEDGTAVYGTTTITRAATNLQLSNLSFNQVVQAVDMATGTTAVSGQITNMLAQHDTDTGRAAAFFFNLASDNVDLAIRGLELATIGNNIFSLGGGNEGRLRITGIHVGANLPNFIGSGYGTIGPGTHAFVLNKNSRLDLPDGTQTIQPGPNAGSIIACGVPTGAAGSNCGMVIPRVDAVTPTAP